MSIPGGILEPNSALNLKLGHLSSGFRKFKKFKSKCPLLPNQPLLLGRLEKQPSLLYLSVTSSQAFSACAVSRMALSSIRGLFSKLRVWFFMGPLTWAVCNASGKSPSRYTRLLYFHSAPGGSWETRVLIELLKCVQSKPRCAFSIKGRLDFKTQLNFSISYLHHLHIDTVVMYYHSGYTEL